MVEIDRSGAPITATSAFRLAAIRMISLPATPVLTITSVVHQLLASGGIAARSASVPPPEPSQFVAGNAYVGEVSLRLPSDGKRLTNHARGRGCEIDRADDSAEDSCSFKAPLKGCAGTVRTDTATAPTTTDATGPVGRSGRSDPGAPMTINPPASCAPIGESASRDLPWRTAAPPCTRVRRQTMPRAGASMTMPTFECANTFGVCRAFPGRTCRVLSPALRARA